MELAYAGKMRGDQIALPCRHAALDELHDGAWHSVSNATENHAESSSGFALALACVDDDQTFFAGLGCHDFVARGLFLGHLYCVAVSLFGHVFSCSS